jgi:hypothetical protein
MFYGAKYGEEAAEKALADAGYSTADKEDAAAPGANAEAAAASAEQLKAVLQGCSLYVLGLGPKKAAIARALAQRLGYRNYDITQLMCTTVKTMNPEVEALSLRQLLATQPLGDVEGLARAVLSEVQQFARSVFAVFDGSVEPKDFMIMQQGLVIHLEYGAEAAEVSLPAADTDATLARWAKGHAQADVTVALPKDAAADQAVLAVSNALLAYIEANPSKSGAWKAKADEALGKS